MARVSIDPASALDAAERALSLADTAEAELALRRALAGNPPSLVLEHDDLVYEPPEFSPDGTLILVSDDQRRYLPAGADGPTLQHALDGRREL